MEGLPLLAMEALCQYLSVADLTACSAVSRGWRTVFNEDSLWRPHCEPDLEEVLRTTPPTVRQDSPVRTVDGHRLFGWLYDITCTEPSPTSTEREVTGLEESTSLEPLCQWRQAHIRQGCFINNWKHVRFLSSKVTLDCKYESCCHPVKFITDDVISVKCSSSAEITLWNVKSHPPAKCEGPSFPQINWRNNTDFQEPVFEICIAKTIYLVALKEKPRASEIHIWDLKTGEYIKKEPLPPNEYLYTLRVAGEDVLVVTVYYKAPEYERMYFYDSPEIRGYRYYIYNVKLLAFLSFTAESELMTEEDEYSDDLFGIVENYLIIQSVFDHQSYTYKIFNYKTNELLHESPLWLDDSGDVSLRALADGFIYRDCNVLSEIVLFDPRNETVLKIDDRHVGEDLLWKIWRNTLSVKTMSFLFKHLLFSNVSEATFTGLFDITSAVEMSPSCHVGFLDIFENLTIIRFW